MKTIDENTSSQPGATMALPPGTASQMESQRAEELRRRQQKQQQQQQQQQATTQPSPRLRRLGPQRGTAKKKTLPPKPIPSDVIPIEISRTSEQEDDIVATVDLFHDQQQGGSTLLLGLGNTRNVADFTASDFLDNHNKKRGAKQSKTPVIVESKEEDDDDDEVEDKMEEKEYHGEIESVASSTNSDNDSQHSNEEEDVFKIISEDEVSLNNPPPTEPVVLVNLESLCGCAPEDEAEKLILARQLMESLLGHVITEDGEAEKKEGSSSNILGDGFSLDFNERVVELFESGVAQHADSSHPFAASSTEDEESKKGNDEKKKGMIVNPYAAIPYPEFLSEHKSTNTRSTLRLWKLLHTTPTVTKKSQENSQMTNLLTRLFAHLRNTSRSLLWKADMHHQLSIVAKQEYLSQIQRSQQKEYAAWKDGVRRERLDKLYEVRETIVLRVDMSKKKWEGFVVEREGRVEQELRRRGFLLELQNAKLRENEKNDAIDNNGDVASEEYYDDEDDDGWGGATVREDDILGTEESSFAREQREALVGHAEIVEEEVVEVAEEVEDDEWAPLDMGKKDILGMNIMIDGAEVKSSSPEDDVNGTSPDTQEIGSVKKDATEQVLENKLEPISHSDNLQRKSARLQKKQQQNKTTTSPDDTKKQRTEYLKRQEASIREMLKTNDERLAHATYLKIQERLDHVDELLESLQEEEWADDDEDEEGTNGGLVDEDDKGKAEELATMLDQILAMILGALPPKLEEEGSSSESSTEDREQQHYQYIREEHKSISNEWVKTFGRLPPFPSDELEEEEVKESEPVLWEVGNDNIGGVPFGDGLSDPFEMKKIPPGSTGTQQNHSSGKGRVDITKELTLIDNDESNWDEVEDWDALLP